VGAPRSVVIVGTGQGGCELAAALRAGGYDGSVTMVGEEPGVPYERPPLSKALLAGEVAPEQLALRPQAYFDERQIELLESRRVLRIDRPAHRIELDDGTLLPYEHLVLATGARNRTLALEGAGLDGVVGLRTLADSLELSERIEQAQSIVIVGAGFIGLEVASVARRAGREVTVLELAERAMTRTATAPTAGFFARAHREHGVKLEFRSVVRALRGSGGRVSAVEDSDGARHAAEVVLIAVGVQPNDELAAGAGLAVAAGILVDDRLLSADPAISAIGDCARFPCALWRSPVLLESVQNAADQAHAVAMRILGGDAPYATVPWFWSDQAGLRLQIAGRSADAEQVVVCGDPEAQRFSALCFREGRLCGVESVGRPGDHVAARRLLAGDPGLSPAAAGAADFDLKAYARSR
jgi:3-phenylpropionate/trans-cinnamate dioxygenase ferredoxin reductase component